MGYQASQAIKPAEGDTARPTEKTPARANTGAIAVLPPRLPLAGIWRHLRRGDARWRRWVSNAARPDAGGCNFRPSGRQKWDKRWDRRRRLGVYASVYAGLRGQCGGGLSAVRLGGDRIGWGAPTGVEPATSLGVRFACYRRSLHSNPGVLDPSSSGAHLHARSRKRIARGGSHLDRTIRTTGELASETMKLVRFRIDLAHRDAHQLIRNQRVWPCNACNCWGSRLSSGLRTHSGPTAAGKSPKRQRTFDIALVGMRL